MWIPWLLFLIGGGGAGRLGVIGESSDALDSLFSSSNPLWGKGKSGEGREVQFPDSKSNSSSKLPLVFSIDICPLLPIRLPGQVPEEFW